MMNIDRQLSVEILQCKGNKISIPHVKGNVNLYLITKTILKLFFCWFQGDIALRSTKNLELKLAPDNVFLMRLLSKVRGNLLTFFGQCIRQADSWEQFKARVLKEYFLCLVGRRWSGTSSIPFSGKRLSFERFY